MARRSTKAPRQPEAGILALPAELTIYAVGELHPAWRDWVAAGGSQADARAVDQVDAAGLQLLLALARSVAAQGRALHLAGASRALAEGCAVLGLASWLAAHAEGAAA
jgi:ABC-type transporter Mla MlaB component